MCTLVRNMRLSLFIFCNEIKILFLSCFLRFLMNLLWVRVCDLLARVCVRHFLLCTSTFKTLFGVHSGEADTDVVLSLISISSHAKINKWMNRKCRKYCWIGWVGWFEWKSPDRHIILLHAYLDYALPTHQTPMCYIWNVKHFCCLSELVFSNENCDNIKFESINE